MMLRREDGDGVIRTFARLFQGAYLEKSHNRILPFVHDNTAQSDLYRILDLMDSEIGVDTTPQDISMKLVLTLLQCAAGLYEGEVDAKKEATDLIKCKEFGEILTIGIKDKTSQAMYEKYIAAIKDAASSTENAINALLLSAKQENRVRQFESKAVLVKNIASLCHGQLHSLQNICESATSDDLYKFSNFATLVGELNFNEISWLVILFPHLFQLGERTCKGVKESEYKGVARQSIPHPDSVLSDVKARADSAACGADDTSINGSISSLCLSPNIDWSFPNHEDEDAGIFRLDLEPCYNSLGGKLGLSPLAHGSGVVSPEIHGAPAPAIFQGIKPASSFADLRQGASGYQEHQQRSAMYPSYDTQIDGELLQLFANMKLQVGDAHSIHHKLSLGSEDPTLIQCWLERLQESMIGQHNLTSASVSITVFKNVIIAGNRQKRYHEEQTLSTIIEESHEQAESEERSKEEKSERNHMNPKTVDLSFLELPCALEKTKLREVRFHLETIQVLGWDEFWKRAKEGDSILADVFATILWMASTIEAFRKSSSQDSFQLISIQLDSISAELALLFLRGDRSDEAILRIRAQLKSVLRKARVTEAEFLPIINTFVTSLNHGKKGAILCQMVHWIGKNGEYRTFLAGFVPAGILGKDERRQ